MDMTVTLTKQITLKSADIYLKLEKKVKREDIQNYLNGKKFDDDIVENRVRDYLKELRVFDEQYHLTTYGNEVKKDGMVDVLEEGKYSIWITQNDTLFGNKIFFLKRQKPDEPKGDKFDEINIDEKNHFCLSSNKKDFFSFNLKNSNKNKYNGIKLKGGSVLIFSWKWNDLESSVYTFEGRIENTNIDKNIEIESDEDLNKKIIEILSDWNSKTNRCKMPFKKISNQKSILSLFKCKANNIKWEDFDVDIKNLPIEPCDKDEAKEWRNAIFNMELEENYLPPDKFAGNIKSINQKEGFKAYFDQLDIPEINQYISDLDPSLKSKRGQAFWHLAAPLDLNI